MATPRPITFLSDYGYEDEFAGVCRAVISQIAPGAPLIDLTHGIARQDIRQGAFALANALPSCPPGVHLAVVDPGVGSARRAVAVAAAEGRFLVGPDNGLLSRALDRLGGALDAVEISRSAFRLEPVSATFHGRDLFAPVAAHLSLGARLDEAGESIDPGSLAALDLPTPRISKRRDRGPRDPRGRLRQRDPRRRLLDARRRPHPARETPWRFARRMAASRRSGRAPSRTSARPTSCSSRTPRGPSPWPSAAAAPPG